MVIINESIFDDFLAMPEKQNLFSFENDPERKRVADNCQRLMSAVYTDELDDLSMADILAMVEFFEEFTSHCNKNEMIGDFYNTRFPRLEKSTSVRRGRKII